MRHCVIGLFYFRKNKVRATIGLEYICIAFSLFLGIYKHSDRSLDLLKMDNQ